MGFDEAKAALKNGYLTAGFELVDEHSEELFFKYRDLLFRITKEGITEYADSEEFRSTLEAAPVECSICSSTYREQIVQPLDLRRIRPHQLWERGFLFGDSGGDSLYVEISLASTQFVNYFLFDEAYIQLSLERMRMRRRFAKSNSDSKPLDIREQLYIPITIKVYNIPENSTDAALKYSSRVIESCLFELSYLSHITLGLKRMGY